MLFEKGIKSKSKRNTTDNEKKNFFRKTHAFAYTAHSGEM